jgi:hypothetical protein
VLGCLCAGQGHDILTVAARHRRGPDVTGRLVELLPGNVVAARERAAAAGLDGIEVVEGTPGCPTPTPAPSRPTWCWPAGSSATCPTPTSRPPSASSPGCAPPGATFVWTRDPGQPTIIGRIEGWLREAGFATEPFVMPDDRGFGAGPARLTGDPFPFEPGRLLFRFVR